MSGIQGQSRLFVLEYDFSKYFDSIRHEYLESTLTDYFEVSDREISLIKKILNNSRARSVKDYQNSKFETPALGIPQGSSVSLFLANVACYELDREIEQVGVVFARYADDTLIITDSYEKADRCAKFLIAHGDRSGTKINFAKSPGISLLTSDANAEFKNKEQVYFLAHSLSSSGIKIAEKSTIRIKQRCSDIIYKNLLLQPKRGLVNPARIGSQFHDWDLVTCVNELRRYIYGRISESALSDALSGRGPVNITRCAMSFYPTVDKAGGDDLRRLDGWLVDALYRAYKKRCQLLGALGITVSPVSIPALKSGSWYTYAPIFIESKLPSFYKSWLYVKKSARLYELEKFPSPQYGYE